MTSDAIPTAPDAAAPPRRAATVILLRDAPKLEVLMLRRHSRSGFAASAWVFPGGVVDPEDALIERANWSGIRPEELAGRFDVPAGEVLALHVAAVRETFEEAGVLLGAHADGTPVDLTDPAVVEFRQLSNDRTAKANWAAFLTAHDLVLDLGAVTCLSRWVTPAQEPRRYDTFFFVAHVPEDARPAADDVETTEARWVDPAAALADDDVPMIFPTVKTMELLAGFARAEEVVAHAAVVPDLPPTQPHVVFDDEGDFADILLPEDDGYPHELYR